MPAPKNAQRALRRRSARAMGQAPRNVERAFVATLRRIQKAYAREVLDAVESLAPASVLGRLPRADASWLDPLKKTIASALKKATERASKAFDRMAKAVKRFGARPAATALQIKYTDLGLDGEISRARAEFLGLVDKAGRGYAEDVRRTVEDPSNQGVSWVDLKRSILERADVSESRAELIARDQTLKLNGRINQVRQTSAGVTRYRWSTSSDERVRDDHAVLEGTIQEWSTPPVVDRKKNRREHPGGDFQCRCVAIPLIPGIDPEAD